MKTYILEAHFAGNVWRSSVVALSADDALQRAKVVLSKNIGYSVDVKVIGTNP